MSSPPTSEVPRGRGGRTKWGGRAGRAGGGHTRGRRTVAPSSLPPLADSPEHKVDRSSESPVLEEEATSQRTSWGPWPEVETPEGEVGEEREVGEEDVVPTDDEAEGAEGNTV